MKKTLAAVAILGAFAGSAMADVTVYGRINTGLTFADKTVDSIDAAKVIDKRSFSMETGEWTGSRLGFKGSQVLGEGLKASFVLEAGLKGDTGTGDMFRREATVNVEGAYGKVGFGRMGTVASSAGTYAQYAAIASVMSTGTLSAKGTGLFATAGSRLDNAIVYQTPVFGGFQVTAQMGTMGDTAYDDEDGNRYYAVAGTYKAGALKAVAVAEAYDRGDVEQQMFGLGATYDFGVAKVSLGGQMFKNAADIGGMLADLNAVAVAQKWTDGSQQVAWAKNYNKFEVQEGDGYGLTASFEAPVAGGKLAASVTYVDGDGKLAMQAYNGKKYAQVGEASDFDASVLNFGVNYSYNLSKQFMVYVGAGYTTYEAEDARGTFAECDTYAAHTGMVYYF